MAPSYGTNFEEVEFWCIEPLDSGLLVTYIVGVQMCRATSALFV